MAESSKSAVDNSKISDDQSVTAEQIQAIIHEARENPKPSSISWPPPTNGTSPAEAMQALLDIEEEALRDELQDPETTEEERAVIRQRLNGMQTQRRWYEFMRAIGSSSTNPQNAPRSDDDKPSRTGKELSH